MGLSAAVAADLSISPLRRRAVITRHRYVRHYAVLYNAACGRPYVGGGWNGGTYWGRTVYGSELLRSDPAGTTASSSLLVVVRPLPIAFTISRPPVGRR